MKKYTVHWTYEVVSLPVDQDWEYEVFLTFHPKQVPGSYPLKLTAEDVRDHFFPEIFEYSGRYGVYDTEQDRYEVIRDLDSISRVEAIICEILNTGNRIHDEIVAPLEKRAYKECEEYHAD